MRPVRKQGPFTEANLCITMHESPRTLGDNRVELYDEFFELIETLAQENIEYAVCGGIAVAFHGYARFTKDIDILIRDEDLERILAAIRPIGFIIEGGRLRFGVAASQEREIYRISKADGTDLLTLDLVIVNPLLEAAWNTREEFEILGRLVKVVSLDGLAEMKSLAGREQDILDLKMLGVNGDDHETSTPH